MQWIFSCHFSCSMHLSYWILICSDGLLIFVLMKYSLWNNSDITKYIMPSSCLIFCNSWKKNYWNWIYSLIAMKVTHGLVNQNKCSKDRKSIDMSDRKGMAPMVKSTTELTFFLEIISFTRIWKDFVTLNIYNKLKSERLNR